MAEPRLARTLLAFAAAGPAALVTGSLFAPLLVAIFVERTAFSPRGWLVMGTLAGVLGALPALLTAATMLPLVHHVLSRHALTGVGWYASGGVLASLPAAILLLVVVGGIPEAAPVVIGSAACGGAVGGAAFWLIRRPAHELA